MISGVYFFGGASAGYQALAGANKATDEEPVVPPSNGNLSALSFEKGGSGTIVSGLTNIYISKHNVALSPTTFSGMPGAPPLGEIMGTITINNTGGSSNSIANFVILPGESGIPVNWTGTATVSWTIGAATNSYTRGNNILLSSDQGMANQNFTLYTTA